MKADTFVNSCYNENNNHHYNENNNHHYNENNNHHYNENNYHSYIMLRPWKITSSVCCTVYIIINKSKNKNKISQNGHTYCTHIQTTLKQSWINSHMSLKIIKLIQLSFILWATIIQLLLTQHVYMATWILSWKGTEEEVYVFSWVSRMKKCRSFFGSEIKRNRAWHWKNYAISTFHVNMWNRSYEE